MQRMLACATHVSFKEGEEDGDLAKIEMVDGGRVLAVTPRNMLDALTSSLRVPSISGARDWAWVVTHAGRTAEKPGHRTLATACDLCACAHQLKRLPDRSAMPRVVADCPLARWHSQLNAGRLGGARRLGPALTPAQHAARLADCISQLEVGEVSRELCPSTSLQVARQSLS